jgi:pimeloyl-ACP methyl ester carboxylesterase
MLRGALRAVRYARCWSKGADVERHEIEIDREGTTLPASFLTPACGQRPLPGWIVLGGITRMGRFHPQLSRFANALAASGAGVLIPEVPEWRDLRLAPAVTVPSVRAAVHALDQISDVRHGGYGLVGFSFGAPQAALASTDPELAERISCVMLFGGYCDVERTLRCALTGEHEWGGVQHRIVPDPYGRWVLASNYLTRVPGCEDAGDVASALRQLALASTERRVPAWDERLNGLRDELRLQIPSSRQELYDLFAPVDVPAGCERRESMASELAAACRGADPLLDPTSRVDRMRVPIKLFHGRGDRLVPFTESLRFRDRLKATASPDLTVTGLFAHSAGTKTGSLGSRVRENLILLRGLQRALGEVGA